jgi:predicted MFS family arabinose efflux permease
VLGKDVTIPLCVTLAVQSMVSMVAVTIPVLAPSAAPAIGISATYAGIYVSLIYIGGMLSSLWSGNFIHRYGALRVSEICLALAGIGLICTSFASIQAMIFSAFIIGLGYGPVTPASSHILARTTPAHMRSFIFSLKQTGVPIGGVLAGALVPTLVILLGWRQAAVVVGAVCVLLILFIHPARNRLDRDRQPAQKISLAGVLQPLRLVLRHSGLRRLCVISFLFAGMQLCLFTYLVIYLTEDIGMAFVAAGFTMSAAQMAGTIGRIIWGTIADHYLKPRLLLGLLGVGMSLGAVATALMDADWPTWSIVAVIILFGATAIGWNGVYLAEAARLAPPGKVGDATGGTLFFTFLGVVLGPPLFGLVASATESYSMAFAFFALLTLAGGVVSVAIAKDD